MHEMMNFFMVLERRQVANVAAQSIHKCLHGVRQNVHLNLLVAHHEGVGHDVVGAIHHDRHEFP
jgi:hypothetical protein